MLSWQWREDTDPPIARGAIGFGAVARALFAVARAHAAALPAGKAPAWQATAHRDALILVERDLAERDLVQRDLVRRDGDPAPPLPWVDGAAYIAPRPEAPMLWLPTTRRPDVALDLLARAIAQRHPPERPVLLWPAPAQLIPLQRWLPADDDVLSRIAARWEAA